MRTLHSIGTRPFKWEDAYLRQFDLAAHQAALAGPALAEGVRLTIDPEARYTGGFAGDPLFWEPRAQAQADERDGEAVVQALRRWCDELTQRGVARGRVALIVTPQQLRVLRNRPEYMLYLGGQRGDYFEGWPLRVI